MVLQEEFFICKSNGDGKWEYNWLIKKEIKANVRELRVISKFKKVAIAEPKVMSILN